MPEFIKFDDDWERERRQLERETRVSSVLLTAAFVGLAAVVYSLVWL